MDFAHRLNAERYLDALIQVIGGEATDSSFRLRRDLCILFTQSSDRAESPLTEARRFETVVVTTPVSCMARL